VFFLHHCNVDRIFSIWQDYGNLNFYPSTGQSQGNNRDDILWPWDGGKATPESDRMRDLIRDADPNDTITNASMLNYRIWRYCYDKYIGNLNKFKAPTTATIATPGESHLYDLDITDRGNYRIYTTGTTDVQMELWGPALCNNCFGQMRAKDSNSGDGGINPSISITLAPGKYYAVVRHANPTGSGPYVITCSNRDEAVTIEVGKPFRAVFSRMWEIDWFKFTIKDAASYMIETNGEVDTMMVLYGANPPEDIIAKDDNSGMSKNAVIRKDLKPGVYFVALRSHNSAIGKYTITVRT